MAKKLTALTVGVIGQGDGASRAGDNLAAFLADYLGGIAAAVKEYYRLTVYHLMSEFFLLLMRERLKREAPRAWTKEKMKRAQLISPALSLIFQKYDRHLSLDDLAAACNISKYHFCRIFKEEMGETVIQYVTNYRISLADIMLQSSDKSMEEVAYQCGFENVSYFYRCYKKIKGASPKKTK